MALSKLKSLNIVGIASVLPSHTEDNLAISNLSENERNQLVSHTGIRYRKRVKQSTISVKYLFETAISHLLQKMNWELSSIDVLICVTQTPDVAIPSVSCRIHGDLNFSEETICYDINSGCSGFVYGLHTAASLLNTIDKKTKRAILCCGDISSRLLNEKDMSVQPIFSDGVSAIAIEMNQNNESFAYFNLQTFGKGQGAIFMKEEDGQKSMSLNGIDVFGYSLKTVPDNILSLLKYAENEIQNMDMVVLHQANKIINEAIRKKIKAKEEQTPLTLFEFGNTASASIPLTISEYWSKKSGKNGWILISGFGVGFSVASAIIKFNPEVCIAPLQINC